MALDASIYSQIQHQKPVNLLAQYADMLQMQGAQQQQSMNALKMHEYQRGIQKQNRLTDLMGSGADANALRKAGFLGEANEWEKNAAEVDAKRVKTLADRQEAQNKRVAFYRDNATFITSPEQAAQYVAAIHQDPELQGTAITSIPLEQLVAQIPQDPAQLGAWKQQFALGATDFMKLNAPKITTRNLGGTTDTLATEGLTGATRVLNSAQNTQSPDNAASTAASIENNKRSVGAQYANAAATRDVAAATREAALIGQQLKNDELREKAGERARAKDAAIAGTAAQISVIDKALTHPGRSTATGLSGTVDPRNFVPGTDATDFRVVLDQIGGTAFLQAFESLKGGGQITEVEGKKATDAMARLSRAQSDAEFERSLLDLREVMSKAYERQSGKAFDRAAPGAKLSREQSGPVQIRSDADYNALPSGAVFVGPDGKQRRKP